MSNQPFKYNCSSFLGTGAHSATRLIIDQYNNYIIQKTLTVIFNQNNPPHPTPTPHLSQSLSILWKMSFLKSTILLESVPDYLLLCFDITLQGKEGRGGG